jgi:hypothetical protein
VSFGIQRDGCIQRGILRVQLGRMDKLSIVVGFISIVLKFYHHPRTQQAVVSYYASFDTLPAHRGQPKSSRLHKRNSTLSHKYVFFLELYTGTKYCHLVVTALGIQENKQRTGARWFRGPPKAIRIQASYGSWRQNGHSTLTERTGLR